MSPHDPEGGSWLSDQEQPWGIGCKACSFSKRSSKFAMYAVREAGSLQHENLKKTCAYQGSQTLNGWHYAWLLGFLADAARSYFGSESTKVSFLADAARSFFSSESTKVSYGENNPSFAPKHWFS